MAENSKIEWTHHTFQPWEGCQHVSPGCINCYAETRDKQYHGGKHWGPNSERKPMSESYWKNPAKWNREAEREGVRKRVFCASLADVFELGTVQDEARRRLGLLIAETPNLDWLLLTKRPQNWEHAFEDMDFDPLNPPPNVWVGVTAEDQKRADERIPILLQIPAAVRFVSYEPALELVDFTRLRPFGCSGWIDCLNRREHRGPSVFGMDRGIDQVIIGGESGPGARPFDLDWARRTISDCKAAGVAAFFKQAGERAHDSDTDLGDVRIRFKDKKGGDMAEWPEEFRVREYPA